MPKKFDIRNKLLIENRIEILGEYTASQNHHDMRCLECGHVWSATPKSKIQTLKLRGVSGCPECWLLSRAQATLPDRLKDLESRGLVIVEYEYDGRYITKGSRKSGNNGSESNLYLNVYNRNCGHGVRTTAKNLFNGDIKCGVCNAKRKRKTFQQFNKDRQKIFQQTASQWEVYRNLVESLTRVTYNEFKNEINPMGLPRVLAGSDGGYQLDHIDSKRWCFDNGKSAEWCSRKENLQMLTWQDNLSLKDKPKT